MVKGQIFNDNFPQKIKKIQNWENYTHVLLRFDIFSAFKEGNFWFNFWQKLRKGQMAILGRTLMKVRSRGSLKWRALFDIGLFSFIFLYRPFFFYFWYWPLPYLIMHEESLSAFKRSTTKKKKIIPFLHPKDFILCTIVCKYNRRIAV